MAPCRYTIAVLLLAAASTGLAVACDDGWLVNLLTGACELDAANTTSLAIDATCEPGKVFNTATGMCCPASSPCGCLPNCSAIPGAHYDNITGSCACRAIDGVYQPMLDGACVLGAPLRWAWTLPPAPSCTPSALPSATPAVAAASGSASGSASPVSTSTRTSTATSTSTASASRSGTPTPSTASVAAPSGSASPTSTTPSSPAEASSSASPTTSQTGTPTPTPSASQAPIIEVGVSLAGVAPAVFTEESARDNVSAALAAAAGVDPSSVIIKRVLDAVTLVAVWTNPAYVAQYAGGGSRRALGQGQGRALTASPSVVVDATITVASVKQAAAAGQAIQADATTFSTSIVSVLATADPGRFGNITVSVAATRVPVYIPSITPPTVAGVGLGSGAVAGIVVAALVVVAAGVAVVVYRAGCKKASVSPTRCGGAEGGGSAKARGTSAVVPGPAKPGQQQHAAVPVATDTATTTAAASFDYQNPMADRSHFPPRGVSAA